MRAIEKKGNRTRKILSFYRINFACNPPYEVLCDGPTIFQSLKNDLYLKEALPSLLGAPSYIVVTECVLKELRNLGESFSAAALFAKRAKRIPCVHTEQFTTAAECLSSRIKVRDEVKLILATNDVEVLRQMLPIPGIPIISITSQKKLVLKPPSPATLKFVSASQKEKSHTLPTQDKILIDQIDASERALRQKFASSKKRNRAKGPNPLSVKKPRRVSNGFKKSGKDSISLGPKPLSPDLAHGQHREQEIGKQKSATDSSKRCAVSKDAAETRKVASTSDRNDYNMSGGRCGMDLNSKESQPTLARKNEGMVQENCSHSVSVEDQRNEAQRIAELQMTQTSKVTAARIDSVTEQKDMAIEANQGKSLSSNERGETSAATDNHSGIEKARDDHVSTQQNKSIPPKGDTMEIEPVEKTSTKKKQRKNRRRRPPKKTTS